MPKQINPKASTEKEGLIHVQSIVNDMNCIWRPTPNDDYGIDGEIELTDSGQPTGRILKVQVKSGQSYFANERSGLFDFLANPSDLAYWLNCNVPVLLMLYDPRRREAYWKCVSEYVAEKPEAVARPHRIRFSRRTDKFQKANYVSLCKLVFADEAELTDFLKDKVREVIYANLLPVLELPENAFTFSISDKRLEDIEGDEKPPEGLVAPSPEGLLTFHEPTATDFPLAAALNRTSIKTHQTRTLLRDKDYRTAIVGLWNKALNAFLTAKGLFQKEGHRFYFPPAQGNLPNIMEWEPIRRNRAVRKVAYPYKGKKTGEIAFWIHHALRTEFRFVGGKWYLKVVPAYVFTRDGATFLLSKDTAALSTSKMSHERNYQVLNHLLFWAWFLRGKDRQIKIPCGSSEIAVSPVYGGGVAHFGIGADKKTLKSILRSSYDIEWSELEEEATRIEDEDS